MAHAMVLCAGFGTRLRPLTDVRPKPLVPLGDRPLLAHLLDRLGLAGLDQVVLNAHHLAQQVADFAAGRCPPPLVVHEATLRGTAGGLAGARPHLPRDEAVVLWNGDILADVDLAALRASADDGLLLALVPRAPGEGTVGVDELGRVVRLRGRRFGREVAGGDYVGVAAVGPRALAALPEQGCLVGDHALPTLEAGGVVRALPLARDFADLGTPAEYLAANLRWLDVRGGTAFVAPDAEVHGTARLDRCVVGAGARVGPDVTLREVVVWPGAEVTASAVRSVVVGAPAQVVPADSSAQGR